MKKTLLFGLAAVALVVSMHSMVRASEDPDTTKWHISTIRWITANQDDIDTDDRYVVIIGKVTEKVGDESYIFDDGTGKIQLDSEDFDLPIGKPIVVRGKIDQDFFGNSVTGNELEVDVRSWRKE